MNSYERPGNFETESVFECEGKKYRIKTGRTEGLDGNKYKISLFREGSDPDALPMREYTVATPGDLAKETRFLEELASRKISIDDIIEQWTDHIIDLREGRENK